jgi:TRAP-type C4-dicarboxylate transport system permease small subunit
VLQLLSRGLHLLDVLIEWVVVALMVSLVVIVSLQFIDRHFIDTGIAAPDQYARVGLVWLTFIGFAIAVRAALNVRVDLIDAHLPAKIRHVLALIFDALMIVLLAVLVRGAGASSRSAKTRCCSALCLVPRCLPPECSSPVC